MPKLAKKDAKRVAEHESEGFEALPVGRYTVKLNSVTDVDDQGEKLIGQKSGVPYWKWEFELDQEGMPARRFWMNTSLGENSDWKMKETFEAFGYSPDSDTDEMIGEHCTAVVGVKVAEQGKYQGEKVNEIQRLLPLEEEDPEEEEAF